MSFPGLGCDELEFYDSECWWREQSSLIVYNYVDCFLAPAAVTHDISRDDSADIIVYSIVASCQAIYTVDENDK